MKKFINFLSLALIAMLSFASCSSDNNEPSNSTPANYLVGKTFQEGDDQTVDDNNWAFYLLKFTSNDKGTLYREFVELGVDGAQDDTRQTYETEFSYTYTKPTLTITFTKLVKEYNLIDGTIKESPEAKSIIGQQITLIVDETLNTLTHTDGEDTRIFTLKK